MNPQTVLAAALPQCSLGESLRRPLYDPHENYINPCTLAWAVLLVQGTVAVWAFLQATHLLLWNSYGPYRIKYSFGSVRSARSVGAFFYLRAVSCGVYCALIAILAAARALSPEHSGAVAGVFGAALAVSFFGAALVILPLVVVEVTRSPVGHASVIVFWLTSFVVWTVVFASDSLSPHKTFLAAGAHGHAISRAAESLLPVSAILAYLLEVYFYRPSVELTEYFDLNGWDISTVRNLVATLTFTWLEPTMRAVYKTHTIDVADVPQPVIELKCEVTISDFRKGWEKEVKRVEKRNAAREKKIAASNGDKKQPKLARPIMFFVLFRTHYKMLFRGMLGEFIDMSCLTLMPFLLQKFILYFAAVTYGEGPPPPLIQGLAIALAIYAASVVRYVSFNQYFICFFFCSYSISSSLTALCYEKAMRLSPEARKKKSSGDIVNLVSADITEVSYSVETMSDAVTIPLRLVLCLGAIYKLLGSAMFAGLATALVLVPLSSAVSRAIYSLYTTQMTYKDERIRLTSEILNAIKSIKLYSWEKPMLARLHEIRNKKELVNGRNMGLYNAGASFLWSCVPFAISCAVYSVYATVSKKDVVPSVIFPALSLFDLLAQPLLMLPAVFSNFAEATVSMNRLGEYFSMAERDESIIQHTMEPISKGEESIKVKDATFVFSAGDETPALKNINFSARKGNLTCVVGKVGAGKTTLMKALIGEISLVKDGKGSVHVNGTVAYCAQNAWIMNSSVRENILFGKRYDKKFYEKTVEACQLVSDFESLPDGDATLVGEKGISLSGGQKARLSLARAVYSRADIYLLDDVLSAVDSHVGKKITNAVLSSTGLLASKTIVLATNSIRILSISNETVFLHKGEIVERGSFDELMKKKGEVYSLVSEFSNEEAEDEQTQDTTVTESEAPESKPQSVTEDQLSAQVSPKPFEPGMPEVEDLGGFQLAKVDTNHTVGQASAVSFDHVYEFDDDDGKVKTTELVKEVKEKGHVKWAVFAEYLKACNWIYVIVWLVIYWAVIGSEIGGNVILKHWSEKNLKMGHNVDVGLYLMLYAFTGIASGILTFVGAYIILTFSSLAASKHFHDRMATSVLRAPMSFFDTTPMGRILNRFSDDVAVLDQQYMWTLMSLCQISIETIAKLSIVIYNLPLMILVIGVLFFLYNYFRSQFIPTSREFKRLKSALRSPVFSHLQESVNGVESLRAYGEIERFIHSNRVKVDNVIKVEFAAQCANRWLSMRLQSIAAIVVLSSTLMILLSIYLGKKLNPALVGFLMTYVFSSTSSLNAIIRMWADAETKAVNIERLIEYGNLTPEAEPIIEGHRPASSWPSTGAINFVDYSTRYREGLDPVLKHINLDIKPSEKIGIVGRTGAGKSSLTLALFRIVEPTTGHITIDQLNTSTIGLFDLRSQLNIIPQDACAFEGTIRENLDPFNQYTDEQLWKVLEMAHLKEHVESMKTDVKEDEEDSNKTKKKEPEVPQVGLHAKVLEGGSNLSGGQRQLLCLARALLKTSKVLVLDEATASVDVQTDKIIQETIRSEFKDKTILTIAHRLDTIMDSDRVLVLEKGQVKEFDTPETLLKNKESEFYSLCKEGGYIDVQ
ncbi:hypothetical protein E0198_001337 [Clavispora lusitaniae]|nr:hypothetical protein E0198_001337 [Clavispora lusitaniae]